MTRRTVLAAGTAIAAGVLVGFSPQLARADAGAPTFEICIPITNNSSGITVTSCAPISSSNPLPVTTSAGGSATQIAPGTGLNVGVAPASTAPLANQPSLVVAISPNSPNQTVVGNVGGFDSGPVEASGAVSAASHAAGTSLGGLITLAVARISGGSGGVSLIGYKSSKGSANQVVLRVWSHNPTNTTCTDNTAFAGSAVDDAFLLLPPITLTPAAPAVTTGDANSYALLLPSRLSFVTSGNANLYACAVTVLTDTADSSGNVYVKLGGDLN